MDDQSTKVDDESTSVFPDCKLHEKIDQCISLLNGDHDDQPDSSEIIESIQTIANLFEVMVVVHESGSKRWIQLEEDESSCFIESVDRTNKLIKSLSRFHLDQHYADAIDRMSGIQHRAMTVLEDEFKLIMDEYQTSNDGDQNYKQKELSSFPSNVQDAQEPELPDQPESEHEKDGLGTGRLVEYSNEMLSDLNKLAKGLIKGGHETESSELSDQSESQPKEDWLDSNNKNLIRLFGYTDEMLFYLKKLAKGLIGGGHQTECIEIYFFVRRTAIEENLKLLQFEKFSIDEIQKMQWEPIEKEISSWIYIFKETCTSVLPGERKLADTIFPNDTTISCHLFGNLTRVVLLYLLNFAEAVMLTKRSSEKLFKFLDIYETLRDNIQVVEELIGSQWLHQHKLEASLIRTVLGESIVTMFVELENSIKSDANKTMVPGGDVHPLNHYVMNYLKYACGYSNTLEQIFLDHKHITVIDDGNPQIDEPDESRSPFQLQLTKIMALLDANLELKSRLYKDSSLSLIFMMNNCSYILQKTKGAGGMRTLLGDQWVRKQSSDMQNYHTSYTRETWTKLLLCLSPEGLTVNGKVTKPVLKERFKSFNAMFDEIHRTQSAWVVSDEQLQSELRVSITAIVIPAYRSFMGRFSQVFTPGRQTEKYVKYQPEDIETCIEELFDGSVAQQGKKR